VTLERVGRVTVTLDLERPACAPRGRQCVVTSKDFSRQVHRLQPGTPERDCCEDRAIGRDQPAALTDMRGVATRANELIGNARARQRPARRGHPKHAGRTPAGDDGLTNGERAADKQTTTRSRGGARDDHNGHAARLGAGKRLDNPLHQRGAASILGRGRSHQLVAGRRTVAGDARQDRLGQSYTTICIRHSGADGAPHRLKKARAIPYRQSLLALGCVGGWVCWDLRCSVRSRPHHHRPVQSLQIAVSNESVVHRISGRHWNAAATPAGCRAGPQPPHRRGVGIREHPDYAALMVDLLRQIGPRQEERCSG